MEPWKKTSISIGKIIVLFNLFYAFFHIVAVSANSIKWNYQINGSGKLGQRGLRKGNGVVASADGRQIWVSMDDGSLHILQSDNPEINPKVFIPKQYHGYDIESRSSVSLVETYEGVTCALYAVIYTPHSKKQSVQSHIIAVSHNGDLLWYKKLNGVAMGSPVLGIGGRYIYITHNTKQRDAAGFTRGFLSAIDQKNGRLVFSDSADNFAPFGPPAITFRYGNDILYWGQSWDNGNRLSGCLYKYVNGSKKIAVIQKLNWSVSAAPLISESGTSIWMGGTESSLSGWTNRQRFSNLPTFRKKVGSTPKRSTTPLLNRPVITSNESKIFVSSTSASFHCLYAKTGREIWSTKEKGFESVYMNDPVLSPDETKIYTIRHNDGLVRQIDTHNGRVLFDFSCRHLTNNRECHQSVEAEFSLSSNGNILYYGDIFGNIIALRVVREPTSSPTKSQVILQPSSYPSIESYRPSIMQSTKPSKLYTFIPSTIPSRLSTSMPSTKPSKSPIAIPSTKPSTLPISIPSIRPTVLPLKNSFSPTFMHSITAEPFQNPSSRPSPVPSFGLSYAPSVFYSVSPSHLQLQPQSNYSVLPPTLIPSTNLSMYPNISPMPTSGAFHFSMYPSLSPVLAPIPTLPILTSNPTQIPTPKSTQFNTLSQSTLKPTKFQTESQLPSLKSIIPSSFGSDIRVKDFIDMNQFHKPTYVHNKSSFSPSIVTMEPTGQPTQSPHKQTSLPTVKKTFTPSLFFDTLKPFNSQASKLPTDVTTMKSKDFGNHEASGQNSQIPSSNHPTALNVTNSTKNNESGIDLDVDKTSYSSKQWLLSAFFFTLAFVIIIKMILLYRQDGKMGNSYSELLT